MKRDPLPEPEDMSVDGSWGYYLWRYACPKCGWVLHWVVKAYAPTGTVHICQDCELVVWRKDKL